MRDAYAEAEDYCRKSLAQFEHLGNSPEIAHVLLDLSKSLLRQNQYREAAEQCSRGLQLAIHAKMAPRILSALTLLAEIHIAEGRQEQAARLLQIVLQYTQAPVATQKSAQQLQTLLIAELGEDTIKRLSQENLGQSLHNFGSHMLPKGYYILDAIYN